jgi:NADP-dependent 3-hydroxy acid dehydrogenase YdfG
MTNRFEGRRIAVTGAAGGIGLAICESLAGQGAQVHGLDLKGLDALPAGVTGHPVDVTSEESAVAAVRALYTDDDRPVDLVNSAGIVENVPAEEMPLAEFDRILTVNLRGVFLTCREFGRELLARGGGAIVNIASMSGNAIVNHPQRQCAYNTSKAGVSSLTRSLAVEWGARGTDQRRLPRLRADPAHHGEGRPAPAVDAGDGARPVRAAAGGREGRGVLPQRGLGVLLWHGAADRRRLLAALTVVIAGRAGPGGRTPPG